MKWIYADYHIKYDDNPIEAATKLAEVWCKQKTNAIDMWSLDGCLTEEFFEQFFDYCDEQGLLEEALKIHWGCHNSPGPTTQKWTFEWIDEQINKYKHNSIRPTTELREIDLEIARNTSLENNTDKQGIKEYKPYLVLIDGQFFIGTFIKDYREDHEKFWNCVFRTPNPDDPWGLKNTKCLSLEESGWQRIWEIT
ncbi:MAG: hypothetical protein DWQ19_12295 [Crenarchaeota archaeon]|nr:MAG: hypothetical protein DWQ19_12295 [Thermoproteota archaeon]